MALVQVADCFVDTDDLEQAEYHYLRNAMDIEENSDDNDMRNKAAIVRRKILRGMLKASKIEEREEYAWLRKGVESNDKR